MKLDEGKYRLFFENLPDAFAYHQLVTGEAGKPLEYIFLEVNPAFEEMTGLKREKIVGKKFTEVLPTIVKSKFDWIYIYSKIAQMEEAIRFEYLLEPSGEWYHTSPRHEQDPAPGR